MSLLAYPQEDIRTTPVLQAQLADCYVDALRDEEVKKEVLKAEPENVTRAVHLARRNKNFLERVRKRHRGQKQERISRPTRRNPEPDWGRRQQGDWSAEADPRRQDWLIWKGFHDPPHKRLGVTCWTCRKEGHYSTECPSRNDMRREERETSRKNEGVLSSKAPSYVKESGKRRRAAPGEVKGRVAHCVIARKCWSCGQGDHVARDCQRRRCWQCRRYGHMKKDCQEDRYRREFEDYKTFLLLPTAEIGVVFFFVLQYIPFGFQSSAASTPSSFQTWSSALLLKNHSMGQGSVWSLSWRELSICFSTL